MDCQKSKICYTFNNDIEKGFDNEPVYNEKYIKTKIKSYEGKIHSNIQVDKIPKECSQSICASVKFIYSLFEMGEKYYP